MRYCPRRAITALLGLALAVASQPALGQAPAASASARAAELFEEGRGLYEKKQYAEACEKLAASDKLDPAVGTSGLYAACEEKLGHLAVAYAAYLETAARAKTSGDSRAQYAADRAAALKPRVPRLIVRLGPDAPPDARVLRDGVELSPQSLGAELPVDPGSHVLEGQAPGRPPTQLSVTLQEGEVRELTIDFGPSSAPPPAAPPPAAAPTADVAPPPPVQDASGDASSLRPWAWVAGGVGAAGMVAAVVTGVVVLGKQSDMDADCPKSGEQRVCNADGAAARDDVKPWLTVNTVSWIVGAGGLALGTVLFVVSRKRSPSVTATVVATPQRRGITAQGRW